MALCFEINNYMSPELKATFITLKRVSPKVLIDMNYSNKLTS